MAGKYSVTNKSTVILKSGIKKHKTIKVQRNFKYWFYTKKYKEILKKNTFFKCKNNT